MTADLVHFNDMDPETWTCAAPWCTATPPSACSPATGKVLRDVPGVVVGQGRVPRQTGPLEHSRFVRRLEGHL
jgi:hypothetical protein